jgi:hypothetical protein
MFISYIALHYSYNYYVLIADLLPTIGTHVNDLIFLGRIQRIYTLRFHFIVPPSAHHCWVDSEAMWDEKLAHGFPHDHW